MKIKYLTHSDPVVLSYIFLFLVWVFAMIWYPRNIAEESWFNNAVYMIGLMIAVPVTFITAMGYRDILHNSPMMIWEGGCDTLAQITPVATVYFPSKRGERTFKFPFHVYPNGSSYVLGIPIRGGGTKGYKMVLAIPGMIVESGHNLQINCKYWRTYLPDDLDDHWNHKRLGFLWKNLRNAVLSSGRNGRPWSDGARVDVAIVPSESLAKRLGITDMSIFDDLVDVENVMAVLNVQIKDLENSSDKLREQQSLNNANILALANKGGGTNNQQQNQENTGGGQS